MITTNVGGLQQMIGDTGTGLIAEKIDPTSIALKIRDYFSGNVKEELIGNIRREKERLSWSNFCKKLIDFAEKI